MNRVIIMTILLILIMANFTHVLATGVNMNITDNSVTQSSNTSQNQNTVAKTNSTIIQSVNSVNESNSNTNVNIILNILLIAVGFVLVLLAVAILIRLRK